MSEETEKVFREVKHTVTPDERFLDVNFYRKIKRTCCPINAKRLVGVFFGKKKLSILHTYNCYFCERFRKTEGTVRPLKLTN